MSWPLGFTTLPPIPSGVGTEAHGVSGDGRVVVGEAYGPDPDEIRHAVSWTQSGGLVDLGFLLGGSEAYAMATNHDGSVIVGVAQDSDGNDHAFRWTQAGMVALPYLPGGSYAYAYGISADGAVIVGEADGADSNSHAVYWAGGDPVDLGFLPGGTYSYANAANSDGSVIVGDSTTATGRHMFRWTQAGMVDLGGDQANAVSGDGLVVVGDNKVNHTVRWTQAGLVDLGTLSGGTYSQALGVSYDGTVVVGVADASGERRGFIWTQAGGMVELSDFVGADSGPYPYNIGSISGDGSAVVGDVLVSGQHTAFVYGLTAASNPTQPVMTLGI